MAVKKNLAGRCGIYCGICEIYRAYKDGGRLRLAVAKKYNCLPAEVRFEGCRAVHVIGWSRDENWGRNCIILRGLRENDWESCYDCGSAAAVRQVGGAG